MSESSEDVRLQRYLSESLRVLASVHEINDDQSVVINWYRKSPIREFDNRTAEVLFAGGHAEAVVKFLISASSRATG